jgi:hypothetical protein
LYGIETAFENLGVSFIRQMEISVEHDKIPIKAHLDLVLPENDKRSLVILEIKSAAKSRDHVLEAHETQLYGQMGLLAEHWSEPVFKDGNSDAFVSFPNLASDCLGLSLPDSAHNVPISGFILTVSPDDAKAFGPY